MADMDRGNRPGQAPAVAPEAGISLDQGMGAREALASTYSFLDHPLVKGIGEIVVGLSTGRNVDLYSTAPNTEAAYGREQDSSPGYIGGQSHACASSLPLRLDLNEHSGVGQGASGVTVASRGLQFGSSAPQGTEVDDGQQDSQPIGRIYQVRRAAA